MDGKMSTLTDIFIYFFLKKFSSIFLAKEGEIGLKKQRENRAKQG